MGEGLKRARAAAKATRTKTRRTVTAAERAAIEPLIAMAAVAAVRQSIAEAEWEACSIHDPRVHEFCIVATDAQVETCRAGKALADALGKLRGGK